MLKVHENAIITGNFESYCLLCETHLERNVEDHMNDVAHIEKLQESGYIQKYQLHHIREVPNGYYCEFCNILLPTLSKAGTHISSKEHKKVQGKHFLKKVPNGVIAFGEILISHQAWHCLVANTCFLCDVKFTDDYEHIKSSSHILKLVQSEIELRGCNKIYRNVNNNYVQCLICNKTVTTDSISAHFESIDHTVNVTKCSNNKSNPENENSLTTATEINETENQIKNIDLNDETVLKQQESTTIGNDETIEELENKCKGKKNRNAKKKNKQVTDPEKTLLPLEAIEQAQTVAKNNKIEYQIGKSSALCKVCDLKISSSLKSMKEHSEDKTHKDKLDEAGCNTLQVFNSQDEIKTVTMEEFITSVTEYTYMNDILPHAVAINDKLRLGYKSFLMITRNNLVYRCQACEVTIPLKFTEIQIHRRTPKHKHAMKKTPIIISLEGEFVREVRPGIYHCGFCKFMSDDWNEMKNHLKTQAHDFKKLNFQMALFVHQSHNIFTISKKTTPLW